MNITLIVGQSGHAAPFARRLVDRGCVLTAVPVKPGGLAVLDGIPHRQAADATQSPSDLVLILEDRDDGAHHEELAQSAFDRGTPVFIDKPLGCDLDAADRLFDAAHLSGTPLMTTSAARYAEPVRSLAGGELGDLNSLTLTGTGEVWFYGVHLAEIAVTILGPGFGELSVVDDESGITARARHTSGTLVTFDLDRRTGLTEGFGIIARGREGIRAATLTQYGPWYDLLVDDLITFARTRQSPIPLEQSKAVALVLDGLGRPQFAEQQGRAS